jgi:hypothetical protein
VIGVGDGLAGGRASSPDRHLAGVDDELCAQVIGNRPAHDAPAEGVEDDGQ